MDVEVWCDGWTGIDEKFARCFTQYIHGPTPSGDCGIPLQIRLLNDHGLRATYFVEPLFTGRFGTSPLAEIVGLLRDGRQDVQLHLHTEWVDEALRPLLPVSSGKRQFLRNFSVEEQTTLIAAGAKLLVEAGAPIPGAFRAGSFGFDARTLQALRHNDFTVDASYNATMHGLDSGVAPGTMLLDSETVDGVCELPMTVFLDGTRRHRHLQLTACSWSEMERVLHASLAAGVRSVVVLWHGSELLQTSRTRANPIVIRRLRKLLGFLDRHRDMFKVRNLDDYLPRCGSRPAAPVAAGLGATSVRLLEQSAVSLLSRLN